MAFSIDSNMQFPLVEVTLERGEQVYIQRGSMVYHTPSRQPKHQAKWSWERSR